MDTTCTRCGVTFEKFGKPGTATLRCRPCLREKAREYRMKNPEKHREYWRKSRSKDKEKYNEKIRKWRMANPQSMSLAKRKCRLKKSYGMTLAEYDAMCASQLGVCAICGNGPSMVGNNTKLVVDHCHNSKRIRGLLCDRCNRAIGLLRDDPNILQSAEKYLRKWN